MGVLDSLCGTCDWAKPKPTYCLDCSFVETCGRTVPGDLSNKYCPHVEHDPDVCSIEVKVCEDWKEVRW